MPAQTLNLRNAKPTQRGAGINPESRFHAETTTGFDDGWETDRDDAAPRTHLTTEAARKIITRNTSPDIGFDRSINAYRGCEHGCVYCFARPTHAYLGLSPGVDFETQLYVKPNAAELLQKELAAPGYSCRSIALGTNTDPYQPVERSETITRQILEVLQATNHPVGIVTKSDLVLRDLDILAPMAAKGLAKVGLSVTTLDPKLARLMEPRAPTPTKRLAAIETLADAGVPVSALMGPVIPAINDQEIEAVVHAVAAAGASHANFVLLRLPHEVKDIVRDWLARHFPDRARRVMAIMQAMRGGKDYDATWGLRQRGEGPYAAAIASRFALAAKRNGITIGTVKLRTDLFSPPRTPKAQLELF